MADTKISDLAAVTSLLTTDELVLARSGASNKIDGAYLPGMELDYVEFTSTVNCTATTAASANTIVTSTSMSWAGTEVVLLEFYCCTWTGTSTTVNMTVDLWRDTTDLGIVWQFRPPSTSNPLGAIHIVRRLTAAAGTYSFTARGWVASAATFAVVAGAGGVATAMPGFLRIIKT